MLVKEINFVGSFRFVHEFETAVKWLESGRINPLPLLSSEFSKEEIVNALEFAADKNKAAKVQVYFD
ncbi:L-idonate 5-dehydrogenase [Budvicia aquatica]|nr:L-idonate 5-dehydrogenase [Budvicia aquatica]